MWLLGIIIGINSTLLGVGRIIVQTVLPPLPSWVYTGDVSAFDLETLPSPDFLFSSLTPGKLFLCGAGGLTAVFIWTILFWVIVTVSEGALIAAVRDAEKGLPVRLSASLREGWGWLVRFAAVDTIVFFPWFLLTLVVMIGSGIGITYLFNQLRLPNASIESGVIGFLGGLLCLLPFLLLILLVAWVTVWYRTLAFRDAALLDHGVTTAVRNPFTIIKNNSNGVIGTTVILWGVMTLSNWIVSGISYITFLSVTYDSILLSFVDLTAVLLIALIKAFLIAFTAAVWTIAYQEWAKQ